jgi:aldehyde:ferredoxin oxidoreductase
MKEAACATLNMHERWSVHAGMGSMVGTHTMVQVVVRGKRRLVRCKKKEGSTHTHLCVSGMRK